MPAQSIFTYLEPRHAAEDGQHPNPAPRRPERGRVAALLRRLFHRRV